MNPYQTPASTSKQRTAGNRWARIALLVFLPPVAAVMLWRSRRVHLGAKVLLTVWCVLMSLAWLGAISDPKQDTAVPAATTASAAPSPSPTPSPTPSDTPSPTPEAVTSAPEPVPTPTPTPTPETPTPTPPPIVAPQPQPEEPTPEPEHTTEQAAAYYKNCTEAKAAGAAPLHRGDPGYRSALDRDGDGIACEK
ncbi:excalibur calcium-binding domain-containing protein [Kitasatospora fiedleri]|uniref:excalibur calcium-binding domain-containing protein n=1 Tax=Kitasatospora fiedleri TaxID=2991545 RepID=UPI00249C104B|nr:excalibur calcium-binding domain-containing protein [Kitasatospora fiedleri]